MTKQRLHEYLDIALDIGILTVAAIGACYLGFWVVLGLAYLVGT